MDPTKGMHQAVCGSVWGVILSTWVAHDWSIVTAEDRATVAVAEDDGVVDDAPSMSVNPTHVGSTSALEWHGLDFLE